MENIMKKIRKKLIAHYYRQFGAVFIMILFGAAALNLAIPDRRYSSSEKRNLTRMPEISLEALTSGEFMDQTEDYLADQFVLRDTWMRIRTGIDRMLGKVESQGVYYGKDCYLIERFDGANEEEQKLNQDAVIAFKEKYPEIEMYFMLVPNCVSLQCELLPPDALTSDQNRYIDTFYEAVDSAVNVLDVRPALKSTGEEQQIYYRTDHHWTTDAAFSAYQSVQEEMGLLSEASDYESYLVCSDFVGSLASKSGFFAKIKDRISVYLPEEQTVDFVVTYDEQMKKTVSCFQMDYLKSDDPYQIFFGGNHPQITIETTADTNRKLLIFKDSYANCLIPFLVPEFKLITVVDPRYYYNDIDALVTANSYTDVLYVYNVNTFAEDNNLRLVLRNE